MTSSLFDCATSSSRTTRMSAQVPISIPVVLPTPRFNTHLDPADIDVLKKKLSDSQERQKNILLEVGQPNPYITIVAAFEHALHEGSATALTKPLRTQLEADGERRMTAATRRKYVLVVARLSSLLSATPSVCSPAMVTVPSRVPSTTLLNVAISSPVPTLGAHSSPALLSRSSGALSFQLEVT